MKRKIINTSISLFERKGFAETSIQDIVNSLGVTKGTFYYYFSSKEELLLNIHLDYINGLIERQEEILDCSGKTSRQKIQDLASLLIGDIRTKGLSAKVFFRELKLLSEDKLKEIVPKRNQFRVNIEELIKQGMEKGELRSDMNPTIVTFGILGILNWSYHWFNPDGAMTENEVANLFVEMIMTGIEKGE